MNTKRRLLLQMGAIRKADGWYWGYYQYGIDWKGRFIGGNAREALKLIVSESESDEWIKLAKEALGEE